MTEPRISDLAEADLDAAWEYLAARNEMAADTLIDDILERAKLHARFPGMGRSREDLRPALRSFAVKPYVVFFQAIDDTIEVVRVLHGSRDIDTILRDDE
jgi:toxin ParE1/3/4